MSCSTSQPTKPRVKQEVTYEYAFVISRHGERTPTTHCELLCKITPEEHGQITDMGRQQIQTLGLLLKERYKSLLTGRADEVLSSHNVNQRTLDSAKLTVEALGLHDVASVQDSTDYYKIYEKSLDAHSVIMMATLWHGHFATAGDLVRFVSKNARSPTNSQREMILCLDSVITHVHNGNPIPEWAQPFWDEILRADRLLFEMTMAGSERIMAQYILSQMLNTLVKRYEKKEKTLDKMHLFTVSGMNLFSVVKLLNNFYDARPAYCSTLLVEVFHDDDTGSQVRVYFANALQPILLRLDKLSNPCPVADFISELRRLVLNDPAKAVVSATKQ
ncbi:lysosomal acid phosphatase-like [Ornithodoros turicata]|uniref:lysosomal acid phosphatase-like n=1 Tax=Ornithodoros turicata TaxID=34597 RepID=UPI0031386C39